MKKWIKVLLAIAAVAACLSAVLAKLHLENKRKQELDEFLLPEEDETVVVDIPVKDAASEESETEEFLA